MENNTIYYVVGFLFNPDMTEVVLIKKNRPDWQKGLLNGVGGKIESGEDPITAMIREFKEETGLEIIDWFDLVEIKGNGYVCYFFYSVSKKYYDVKTKTDEMVFVKDCADLYYLPVIENLKWLIPMCKDKNFGISGKILKSTIEYL